MAGKLFLSEERVNRDSSFFRSCFEVFPLFLTYRTPRQASTHLILILDLF